MTDTADRIELAREAVDMSKRAGATASEILIREGSEFSATVRLGALEKLHQASFRKLGVRVLCGTRGAVLATSDFSARALRELIRDAVEMAHAAGEDPAAGIPELGSGGRAPAPLALCYPFLSQMPPEAKIDLARRCEGAALRYDPRINNSEGSTLDDSLVHTTYGNSLGVYNAYSKTTCTLSVTPLAEQSGLKQRDYWLSSHLNLAHLQAPEEVGAEAARRTLRRLGARKLATCEAPVIFEPLAAASVLKHLSEAVSGTALLRKASFLTGSLGSRIASPLVTICDDALRPAGLGSRPFDAEGVHSQSTPVISEGVLQNYLLDSYSARKLGLVSTGNSNREPQGGPSVGPSNFYLKAGDTEPAQIIRSVRQGLFVTELIGFGVNIVSGNFSQGAVGHWIENGELAYPVEEITIAGNLKDMLTRIEAVGNDLLALGEVFAPTVLIGRMVISGN